MLVELLTSIWRWLWRKDKSSGAFEGFNLLAGDQRKFNHQVLEELGNQRRRLDDCERDRNELHSAYRELESRVQVCEEDREDLRKHINKHSIEIKSAIGITDEPKPPHRTTRKHFPDAKQQDAENE